MRLPSRNQNRLVNVGNVSAVFGAIQNLDVQVTSTDTVLLRRRHVGTLYISRYLQAAAVNMVIARQNAYHVESAIVERGGDVMRSGTLCELLVRAAAEGKVATVSRLISAAANVNCRDENGLTPLMHAVTHGFREPAEVFARTNALVIRLLVGAGADVNLRDEWGNTALMHSVLYEHTEYALLLLQLGSDPNLPNQYGETPLTAAAHHGLTTIVRALVTSGAQVNHRDSNGYTPLMYAAVAGDRESVAFLLENGAEAEATNRFGETALVLAVGRLDEEMLSRIARHMRRRSVRRQQIVAAIQIAESVGLRKTAAHLKRELRSFTVS